VVRHLVAYPDPNDTVKGYSADYIVFDELAEWKEMEDGTRIDDHREGDEEIADG
jgi:hypothetical protein